MICICQLSVGTVTFDFVTDVPLGLSDELNGRVSF